MPITADQAVAAASPSQLCLDASVHLALDALKVQPRPVKTKLRIFFKDPVLIARAQGKPSPSAMRLRMRRKSELMPPPLFIDHLSLLAPGQEQVLISGDVVAFGGGERRPRYNRAHAAFYERVRALTQSLANDPPIPPAR